MEFKGKISSVTRFGLFIMLDETGADGLVPMSYLPRDYYIHDEKRHALIGKETGRTFRLMDPVIVRLVEADSLRGSTVFEMVAGGSEGASAPRGRGSRRQKGERRKDGGRDKNRKREDRRGGKRKRGR
jgi:ribonuclease R